jgi:uncharacterized membrane protein YhaH (DUF805 family)
MGFGEAIRTCFSKYATFSSRERPSEFWFFGLFGSIAALVVGLIEAATGTRIVGGIIDSCCCPVSLSQCAVCTTSTAPAGGTCSSSFR